MRISDWSADVCSSDLITASRGAPIVRNIAMSRVFARTSMISDEMMLNEATRMINDRITNIATRSIDSASNRSEEHTSELQSLMRISYAVFCLKKTKQTAHYKNNNIINNNECHNKPLTVL